MSIFYASLYKVFSACSKLVFFFLPPLFLCFVKTWSDYCTRQGFVYSLKSSQADVSSGRPVKGSRSVWHIAFVLPCGLWVFVSFRLCSFTYSSTVQSVPYLERLWPCRSYYSWRLCHSEVGRTIWPCVKNDTTSWVDMMDQKGVSVLWTNIWRWSVYFFHTSLCVCKLVLRSN